MVSKEELDRAWWHVGRFFYSFAILESHVNELFERLFNLNAAAFLLIVPHLDLSGRISLISLALKRQGIEVKGLTNALNAIIEVRNVVAHTSFGPDDDGKGNEGVGFDYLSKNGRIYFSDRVREIVGCAVEDSLISYNSFDDLDNRIKQLTARLQSLSGACFPLSEDGVDDELVNAVREAVNRNVLPFTRGET